MSDFNPETDEAANPAIRIAETILIIGFFLSEELIFKRILKPSFVFLSDFKNKIINIAAQ